MIEISYNSLLTFQIELVNPIMWYLDDVDKLDDVDIDDDVDTELEVETLRAKFRDY